MKRLCLLPAFAVIFFLTGFSQSAETGIQGRIVDENRDPVGFATVVLFSLPDSAMTKAGYSADDGSFLFSWLKPGRYYLNISFIGYDTYFSEPLDIAENKVTALGQITMSPFATELGEVVVASTKPVIEVKPDKTVFNIEGSVNAIGNDALELLRKAPGVVVDNNERLMLIGKSGVRVYIDGKQSILTGEDLANYLKTLQSSQIESIEIITQPSSRYEAEGNAGIINIRLIRDKSLGTNATLTLNHNQAVHSRSNGNLNINNRTKRVNTFGNINYALGENESFQYFQRTTPNVYASQNNRQLNSWKNGSVRAGLDVTTGANSTIGVLADGFLNNHLSNSNVVTHLAPVPDVPYTELLLGSNRNDFQRKNYNLNANYRFDNRKGGILNIDVDYGSFMLDGDSFQPNYYYYEEKDQPFDTRIFSADTRTDIDIRALKLDYEKNLFGGTAGAGFKLAQVRTDNDYTFFNVIDGDNILDTNRTNRFVYTENVNAGYVNYKKQWKKIGLQLGVRVEQTDSKGDLTSRKAQGDQTVKQDYVDVFPSGGITYALHQKHSLRLTYSRRIDRPNYRDLNPFEYQLDELTFQKGNPFLRPQYSHSFQLGHTYNYRLNTTLTYTSTDDLMAQLTDTSGMRGAFITTSNIADQDVYSLAVSYPFSIGKTWNVFFNTTVSHTYNRADFGNNKIVDIKATTFNFYAQNSFMLPRQFTLELSGWYNSPGIWGGNFATIEMWAVDAGIQKKIWQNRGNIKVSVSDIFKTMEWGGVNNLGALAIRAGGGWESRQLRLSLTYLMGNTQVKAARRRTTGAEAEAKRLEGDNN